MGTLNTQLATLPNEKRITEVTVDLTKFETVATELLEQAQRAEITDSETYAKGGDLIKIARGEAQKVEDLRKTLSEPFHSMWKFVNSTFKKTSSQFDLIKKEVEPKMLKWKLAEDARLAAIAKAEAKRLEDEALARAALESTAEGQDEVMDEAAKASEKMVETAGVGLSRGNFGSSTGTQKTYTTNVTNQLDFLRALVKHIDDGNKRDIQIGAVIEFRKSGLNALAKDMVKQGVKKMPGAEFVETEGIRVY